MISSIIFDLVLVAIIVAVAVRGWQLGAIRQLIFAAGLLLGFGLSVWLAPILVPYLNNYLNRTTIILLTLSLFIVVFGGLFDVLSDRIGKRLHENHRARQIDATLGTIAGALLATVLIWLAATTFLYGPSKWLSNQIKQSRVVAVIDTALPAPPTQLSKLQHYLANLSLPRVFDGAEPQPDANVAAQPADVQAIYAANAQSVVKITGEGCGGIVEGSGFVAASNVVMTNAHVVAGVEQPVVTDTRGRHAAQVIYFNSDLDIALLRTNNLVGGVLALDTSRQPNGTAGAVLGYPGGGPLTAGSGVVLNETRALGRNIYNQGLVNRLIYTLQANVNPGNSGGPYILSNNKVAGIVFAKSDTYAKTGYAIAASEVAPILSAHAGDTASVSTNQCAE